MASSSNGSVAAGRLVPLSGRRVAQVAAVVLVLVLVVGTVLWLWIGTTGLDRKDRATTQLQAVQLALGMGVAGGGLFALYLAYRRQNHAELVANATEHDATERRVTELYTKAVDQLGSDQAPVRLGGLYALERLAQDNPSQRQTIVNVLCAYLRMPYTPPGDEPAHDAAEREHELYSERTQQRQVRLTAQRILRDHLRWPPGAVEPPVTFWPDTDVDFTDAVLLDADFTGCRFRRAQFGGSRFVGPVDFRNARFVGIADFSGARFTDRSGFGAVTFGGAVDFRRAEFEHVASFAGAGFSSSATFTCRFRADAEFGDAEFMSTADFDDAAFSGHARFGGVTFGDLARFNRATFEHGGWFFMARFAGPTWFADARFDDEAVFTATTFSGTVRFDDVLFHSASFTNAQFELAVPSDLAGYVGRED